MDTGLTLKKVIRQKEAVQEQTQLLRSSERSGPQRNRNRHNRYPPRDRVQATTVQDGD